MRRFNPEKELRKIQKGNKNKVIISVIAILLIIAIGSSYALYQIRYNKQIIYTTVAPFYSKDIQLAVYVDGVKQDEFPEKDDGYVFDNISCDKPSIKTSFNSDTWELTLTTSTTNKCNVKFITKPYIDGSGANYPDLFQGLIPIRYDQGKIYIADYQQKWYDYNNNEWANAVLIDHDNPSVMEKFYTDGKLNVNTEITTDDILQMYVWIPRYKYELFNVGLEGTPKQIINIKFENTVETTGEVSCSTASNGKETCINDENGKWYTHPAFTFGDTQLRGIWVGKFEPSDPTDENGRTNRDKINEITILPDKTSMILRTVSTIFNAERAIETNSKYNLSSTEVDTHMAKNIEWGAIAYLTQSVYGIYKDEKTCNIDDTSFEQCEVWINNAAQGAGTSGVKYSYGGAYTGCVGDSISANAQWNVDDNSPAKCAEGNRWNEKGVRASTTGNMYGIYDISGGAWEYMMALMAVDGGTDLYYAASGFSSANMPTSKYFDVYELSSDYLTHGRGHYGDATKETLVENITYGWNGDYTSFPNETSSWFIRGGRAGNATAAGMFAFNRNGGGTSSDGSFRSVLSAA